MDHDMPSNEEVNQVSAWIKHERESRGWSQRKLANEVGLTNTAISAAEKGTVSIKTWILLAHCFNKPLGEVMPKDKRTDRAVQEWDQIPAEERERAVNVIRLFRS
jgi:transcriptional regulator with XRE-family HTH domain